MSANVFTVPLQIEGNEGKSRKDEEVEGRGGSRGGNEDDCFLRASV